MHKWTQHLKSMPYPIRNLVFLAAQTAGRSVGFVVVDARREEEQDENTAAGEERSADGQHRQHLDGRQSDSDAHGLGAHPSDVAVLHVRGCQAGAQPQSGQALAAYRLGERFERSAAEELGHD